MKAFLLRFLATAAGIFVAVKLLPGLHFQGTALQLAGVALVFGVVNAFLKPLLSILTCPLILLTLGLFTLVVNAVLLLITAYLSQRLGFDFRVDGFWWALLGGIVIGIISTALSLLIPDGDKD
jgi:putative membrane protein